MTFKKHDYLILSFKYQTKLLYIPEKHFHLLLTLKIKVTLINIVIITNNIKTTFSEHLNNIYRLLRNKVSFNYGI